MKGGESIIKSSPTEGENRMHQRIGDVVVLM